MMITMLLWFGCAFLFGLLLGVLGERYIWHEEWVERRKKKHEI